MGRFEREQHLKPLLAAVTALLILCGSWLYVGHKNRLERLDRKIVAARTELSNLRVSLQEYRALAARLQKLAPEKTAASGQNLITVVEGAVEQIGARNQLIYVRPQPDQKREDLTEEGVEIRLEKLQLHQLVQLLYQFEQSQQMLKTSQMRVKTRFDNPELLDAVMTLNRFRENS